MKLSSEFLDQIKEAVSIVDVVGEHVVLRKSGSNFSGLCPFHSERSPSFSVSETKQLYHCYGCKAGGDMISFVMEMNGMSFAEAVQDLAERANLSLPQDFNKNAGGASSQKREKAKTAYKLNRFASVFFRNQLSSHRSSQRYLQERGLTEQTQQVYYVGFAPDAWEGLSSHLTQGGAPLDVARELGLIRPSPKKPGTHIDLFRNRILFPILNIQGKVAGFGGRLIPGESRSSSESAAPKYLNSPESIVFQKSKLVYGLYQAKKYIREKDEAIFVEGYFDVTALYQVGIKNVVATCGTALTLDHLRRVQKFGKRLVVFFDSDQAGQNAAEKSMELGLREGMILYLAQIPNGKDPDEYISTFSNGDEARQSLEKVISDARPIIDIKLEEWVSKSKAHPDDAQLKSEAIQKAASWFGMFSDPVGRDLRIDQFSSQLGVRREILESAAGLKGRAPVRRPTPAPSRTGPPQNLGRGMPRQELPSQEVSVLKAMLFWNSASALFQEIGQNLPPEMTFSDLFSAPLAKSFTHRIWGESRDYKGCPPRVERWLEADVDPQIRSIITESALQEQSEPTEEEIRKVRMNAFRLLQQTWARFSHKLRAALSAAEATNDVELQDKLMKDYLDVQRKMKEFNKFYD